MKKLLFVFALLLSLIGMKAEASNDLIIHGFITEAGTGLPIANQTVTAYATADSSNLNGIAVTDPTGWYTITILNGSLQQSSNNFLIKTLNCNGVNLEQVIENILGVVDEVEISFEICNAQTYPCTPNFGIYTLSDGVYMVPSLPFNSENTYSWTSSNGLNSGEYSFFIPAAELGEYAICLAVSGPNCEDSFCDSISLNTNVICDAQFFYSSSPGVYTLQPIAPINYDLNYTWTFLNGPTFTGYNLVMPGTTVENILVCLTVSGGTCNISNCDTITPTALPLDSICSPNFATSVITNEPLAVSFINTSVAGNTASYLWDFGDGNIIDGLNAEHTYASPGVYTVCLSLYGNGCNDTYCRTVIVNGNDIVCNAEFTTLYNDNGAYLIPIMDSNVSYNWELSNGETSDGQSIYIPSSEFGNISVCLLVTGANCQDTYCDSIQNGQNPDSLCITNFTNSVSSNNPLSIIFNNISPAGNTATYFWQFGDGTSATFGTNDTTAFEHTYDTPGVYNVCLTLNGVCYNTYCREIIVTGNDVQCNASFTYVNDGATLYLNSNYPNVSDYVHEWIINGSELLSNEANPVVPIGLDFFELCHFVTSQNGCSDQFCSVIYLDTVNNNPNCQAYFTYFNSQNNPNTIGFQHQSLMDPNTEYTASWDFGDGTFGDNLGNTDHTYAQSGYYVVCLTITSANCQNTYCAYVYAGEVANPLCDAGFYYYQLTTQPPYLVQFVSNSGFENLNFHSWTFGDGQVSTDANPIMTFDQLGSLNVFHAVVSLENTCADSVSFDIGIYGGDVTSNCSATFGYQQEGADPTSIVFYPYNLTQLGYNYSWSFGDGATSNGANPTHNYATTGYYEVCLTVSLPNDSCSDTYCTYVYAYDQNANLYIYGQVFAGANYADEGTVYLVQQDTTSGSMTVVAETPITGGTYYFSNISPGTYFVRASLSETSAYYSNYVPTYFGSQYYWELAEPIELNINTISNAGYNIALIYSTNPGGPGTVGGDIDDGPFKISAEGTNPIANATVVVTNLSNVPQRWTKTDASGNFSLGNLAYGTYRLMADVAGMPCVPIEFTLSPETPSVDITLMMGTELTGIADYAQAEINGEIFPNPSSDIAQLKMNLQESKQLSFTLTTITGQTVWSQNQTITTGAQTITIPVNELSGGVYLLSLRDAQSKLMGVRRLVIAR